MGGDGGGDPQESSAAEAGRSFAQRGCCYFWAPCFGSGGATGNAHHSGAAGGWERIAVSRELSLSSSGEPWWRRALMRVREWSELLAGPRWKTFIRRLNRSPRGGGKVAKLQYDPLSYALNFDDGGSGGEPSDGELGCPDFSARFVRPPPPVGRASVDLGYAEAPPPVFLAA
ncbi:unnamed protein product [Spirodela intermedia]|uniref:Uncharacterized protein n=1 Tax=Spirodela intermedia TaxID=51605 RepID=A0A7I8LCS8_SPIIN|nr:unnamed protein product [Spirodela intermedia]